jgi:hypothetical protein
MSEHWCPSCLLTSFSACFTIFTIIYQIYKCFHYPGKIEINEIEFPPFDRSDDPVVHAYVLKGDGKSISSSPFSIKLSSYLRLTGIPHTIHEGDIMRAPKGKIPYIIHQGQVISDTQLIIRYLENTFNLETMLKENKNNFLLYSQLTVQEKALCEMIRLTCEGQLYWAIISIRWLGSSGVSGLESNWHQTVKSYFDAIPTIIRSAFTSMIRVNIYHDARAFGLTRHSAQDQCYLLSRTLDSLSALLDQKLFFLGEIPTECDCIAYGTLQALCQDEEWPNPLTSYLYQSCSNLVAYTSRMRKILYPDHIPGMRLPCGKHDPNQRVMFKERTKSD